MTSPTSAPPDERVDRGGLRVAAVLDRFVADELLDGLDLAPERFWSGFAALVERFGPRRRALLARRDELQARLDDWHARHGGTGDLEAYAGYLRSVGYLEPDPDPRQATIDVTGIDPEIATVAGPQLVVPLSNPRYALNAANARWGSLYDALYGTDVVAPVPPAPTSGYDAARGDLVIAYASRFLDATFPLDAGSHEDVVEVRIVEGPPSHLELVGDDGSVRSLADPAQLVGHGRDGERTTVLLEHHGLGVQLVVDRTHPIGRQHQAGIADVVVESAVTAIQDCEDSVATVDAPDKVGVYRSWLGLMTGRLEATFDKAGAAVTRRPEADRRFVGVDGQPVVVPGRALLLVRTVGLHLETDAVLDRAGHPVPEGLLDALVTVTAAVHDLRGPGAHRNSRAGSVYVVQPKLHGSDETAFVVDVLTEVERVLDLPEHTVKLGIMDEERRTSCNLAACIAVARNRVIFVNTGFLDRTGDEIHTLRAAGPVVRKGDMRSAPWLAAYEDRNVDVALAAGFAGHAQVGKGMWAMPDAMADMVATKGGHPRAGASCAWVPSPTAATLHALHYHEVDVRSRQSEVAQRAPRPVTALLEAPLLAEPPGPDEVREELRNNAQGILGYVVRWVNDGIGCSKVPDVHDVALMEDRATLRISSQHLANWIHHGVVDRDAVLEVLHEMAAVVDEQNAGEPGYRPMAPDPDSSPAFLAARELVLDGIDEPNGYTETALYRWRRRVKELS